MNVGRGKIFDAVLPTFQIIEISLRANQAISIRALNSVLSIKNAAKGDLSCQQFKSGS